MSKAFSSRLLGSRLWSQRPAPPGVGFITVTPLRHLGLQPQFLSICRKSLIWRHMRQLQTNAFDSGSLPHISKPNSSSISPSNHILLTLRCELPVPSNAQGRFVPTSIKLLQQYRSYSSERKTAQESPTPKSISGSSDGRQTQPSQNHQPVSEQPSSEGDAESIASSVSKYLHLPKLPHRPSKEELLAAANGFWERLKVRFKWMSIRSMRPWNADEWGAFVSWFMLGHIVWVLVGTTTFFSLLIFSINTVFAQGKR